MPCPQLSALGATLQCRPYEPTLRGIILPAALIAAGITALAPLVAILRSCTLLGVLHSFRPVAGASRVRKGLLELGSAAECAQQGIVSARMKELPASCKVRRVSDAHLSPRQHNEGLALLASDADSGESAEVSILAIGDGTGAL